MYTTQTAQEAITARINGEFDNEQLLKLGILSDNVITDIQRIVALTYPEWLLVCTYSTCYVYCDKRKEVKGDYKEIGRLFYKPLEIKLSKGAEKNYPGIVNIIQAKYQYIKDHIDKPIEISATGQTTMPGLAGNIQK